MPGFDGRRPANSQCKPAASRHGAEALLQNSHNGPLQPLHSASDCGLLHPPGEDILV